jgi:hypothetical protein
MKKILFLIVLPLLFFVSCEKDKDKTDDTKTVDMGANSSNDVYYSFANGVVKTLERVDWDIAFSVPLQTATIIINEGAGVQLWCVGDTNSWKTVGQSTIDNLKPRYNDKTDWMKGAFNQNQKPPFNFGWGTYHMDTHNVSADSIFIIKLSDKSFKKLSIRQRTGASDTYVMRLSDPDGSNPVDASFSPALYSKTKHFIHYSLVNKKVVEAEPDKDKWDLIFTNYVVKVPAGPGTFMDYTVMGVLANKSVQLLKITDKAPEISALSDSASTGFKAQADLIGWDWKINDQVTHLYSIAPNTSYFAKLGSGAIYKIYFTNYVSQTVGTIEFKTKLVE